jgi:arsenate reductase
MAEGLLKSFDKNLIVYSAGTKPSTRVHPKAVEVMLELGVDIRKNQPKSVDKFLEESFDYVITVCGSAKETCPIFQGSVTHNIHIGFDDPDEVTGTEEDIYNEFRRIRNEILVDFFTFYNRELTT